jgi:hypothetical protein
MFVMDLGEEIMTHGTSGMLPIPESDAVMFGIPAQIDYDAHQDEANEGNNFDTAEPEF